MIKFNEILISSIRRYIYFQLITLWQIINLIERTMENKILMLLF